MNCPRVHLFWVHSIVKMRSAVDQTAQCEGQMVPSRTCCQEAEPPLFDDENINSSPPEFEHQLCNRGHLVHSSILIRICLSDYRPSPLMIAPYWLFWSGIVVTYRQLRPVWRRARPSLMKLWKWRIDSNNCTALGVRLKTIGKNGHQVFLVFFHRLSVWRCAALSSTTGI